MKEEAISIVEDYGKVVEKAAYDKVLNILWSKYNQLDHILSSKEADNIFAMSTGHRFTRLYDKRNAMRMKCFMALAIIEEVSELRYGKY
jgi:hypothetical protein